MFLYLHVCCISYGCWYSVEVSLFYSLLLAWCELITDEMIKTWLFMWSAVNSSSLEQTWR